MSETRSSHTRSSQSPKGQTPKSPNEPHEGSQDDAALVEGGLAEGRLDLGPLPRLTGYALRRAQLTVFEDFIATLSELDLRPAEYSVLLLLERNPGSTQTAVAAALGIQRANFVALIDGLERKGLAVRAPSPTDRRSHALGLTPIGRKTLTRAHTLVAEHDGRMIAKIGQARWDAIADVLQALARRT